MAFFFSLSPFLLCIKARSVASIRRASEIIMSSSRLETLKRGLIEEYEVELTAALEAQDPETQSKRSASYLRQQLLCLRARRSIQNLPTTAEEEVELLSHCYSDAPARRLVQMHTHQDESIRLLVQRLEELEGGLTAKGEDGGDEPPVSDDAAETNEKPVSGNQPSDSAPSSDSAHPTVAESAPAEWRVGSKTRAAFIADLHADSVAACAMMRSKAPGVMQGT